VFCLVPAVECGGLQVLGLFFLVAPALAASLIIATPATPEHLLVLRYLGYECIRFLFCTDGVILALSARSLSRAPGSCARLTPRPSRAGSLLQSCSA
jgi:hypothetical protein